MINAATSPASLRVDAVGRRFGGLHVFNDISFAIPEGGTLGVIGPNGAGKTTLINVICGMLPPSSGRILLDGKPVNAGRELLDRFIAVLNRKMQRVQRSEAFLATQR